MVDQLECWVWQAISKHIAPGHLEDSSIANKSLPKKDSMERLDFVRTLLTDNYNSYTFNIYQTLRTFNGSTFLSFSLSLSIHRFCVCFQLLFVSCVVPLVVI